MGKTIRFCSNSDHFKWCRTKKNDVSDAKMPPYRSLQAFRKLAVKRGDKSHQVIRVSTKCIELAPFKREFTSLLEDEKKTTSSKVCQCLHLAIQFNLKY